MGVDSFKIEGRMKSPFYVATVVSVYRRIIDRAWADPAFTVPEEWAAELEKVSHRHYTTAFYKGGTGPEDQNYGSSSYTRHYDFAGVVRSCDPETGVAEIEQRNKIVQGDEIEVIQPGTEALYFTQRAEAMVDEEGEPVLETPHPKMVYRMKMRQPVQPMAIIRKKR